MIFKEIAFQQNAIDKLLNKSKEMLEKNEGKTREIILKAPTGSGKTIIATQYIEKLTKQNQFDQYDLVFLWLSIGDNQLHNQSKKKVENLLNNGFQSELLEDVHGSRTFFKRNSITFVNWEKLNNKKEGKWDNKVMREGDYTNFPEMCENTNKASNIILIVDESHKNLSSLASQELINLINPQIILQMSATPKVSPTQEEFEKGLKYKVEIPAEKVKKSGMIKKEVIINPEIKNDILDLDKPINLTDFVLEQAYKKRLELKKEFEKEGKNINPLCLIQIPNSDKGDLYLEKTKEFLESKNITEENSRLGIKLSEYNKHQLNFKNIEKFNHPLEFVIFKQAIGTGWDCPRSHILVKFRQSESETFNIQTVGRILRMPEVKHYKREKLNKAYVYTNNYNIKVKHEDLDIIKLYKTKLKDDISCEGLISYDNFPTREKTNHEKLVEVFDEIATKKLKIVLNGIKQSVDLDKSGKKNKEILKELGYVFNGEQYSSSILEETTFENIDEDKLEEGTNSLSVIADEEEINLKFNDYISQISQQYAKVLEQKVLFRFLHKYLDFEKRNVIKKQKFYLKNRNKLDDLLKEVLKKYKKESRIKKVDLKSYLKSFELKKYIEYSDKVYKEITGINNYAYSTCFLKKERSKPEKIFEEKLKHSNKVKWWFKNGDSGADKNFMLPYTDSNHNIKQFFPDFLVKYKDGSYGIYEIKIEGDTDKRNSAKLEVLSEHIKFLNEQKQEINFEGGIIVVDTSNEFLKINQSKDYEEVSNWNEFNRI